MKWLLALALILSGTAHAKPILKDFGGILSEYEREASRLLATGEHVIVDGPCESACTVKVLSLPAGQACATARGTFGFHWASDGQFGLPSRLGTMKVMMSYPPAVQAWLEARGGLGPEVLRVPATKFLPRC